MHSEIEVGRKSQPRPFLRPARRTSRNALPKLWEDIATLTTLGLDQRTIARALRIQLGEVRALQAKPMPHFRSGTLSRRSIVVLINGRHAERGGSRLTTRARRLATIATAYSVSELLDEPGVGHVTFNDIKWWLEDKGLTFRE